MKRSWMQIAFLALTAVLAVVVFWQGVRLEALERQLKVGLNGLEDVARTEADNAARRVETALREEAEVITDHALVPTGLDRETRTLTANWTVTLRQRGRLHPEASEREGGTDRLGDLSGG